MGEKKDRGAVACSEGSFRVPSSQDYFSPAQMCQPVRDRRLELLLHDLDVVDHLAGANAQQCLHLLFDFGHECGRVLEVQLCVLTPLADLLTVVAVPRARLVDDPRLGRNIEHQARVADAFRVHDVELGLLERRRHLVLDDLYADVRSDDVFLVLDRPDATNVEPNRRVELERLATGRRLGIAEHDADLFAQLIDEHDRRLGPGDGASQLAQRLAHESRLQADVRIAHVAFDLGLWHEGRDRIDDDDVHRTGTHENLTDLERLLTSIGLRDEQRFDVDPELSRVFRVQRVLRVDVRRDTAIALRVRDHMQAERGLTARFRAVDLGDATARNSTHANRRIEVDCPSGNRFDSDFLVRSQPHDRALATALLDLRDGQIQRLLLVILQSRHSHVSLLLSVRRSPLSPCSVIVRETGAIRYPNKIRKWSSGFKLIVRARTRSPRVEHALDRLRPVPRCRRTDTIHWADRAGRSRPTPSALTPFAWPSLRLRPDLRIQPLAEP